MAMVEEAEEGNLILSVDVIHGSHIVRTNVKSYRISMAGLHYELRDGKRRFIPHANIALVSMETYNGEWK